MDARIISVSCQVVHCRYILVQKIESFLKISNILSEYSDLFILVKLPLSDLFPSYKDPLALTKFVVPVHQIFMLSLALQATNYLIGGLALLDQPLQLRHLDPFFNAI